MATRIMRRSGVAIVLIAELIDWVPDYLYQIGIGQYHEEMIPILDAWPNVKVIGCEPHPIIYRDLLKKGDYPGEIHEIACSNFAGVSTLYSKTRHKDGSSLFPHLDEHENESYSNYQVPVTTLDRYFGEPKGNDVLLWLDCEGSELRVLQGAENFLKKVNAVNVELTAKVLGEGWCDQCDVHRFLVDRGFYRQWVHTQRSSAGQNDVMYVRPHIFNPNYCCCPCEIDRYREKA